MLTVFVGGMMGGEVLTKISEADFDGDLKEKLDGWTMLSCSRAC